MKYLVANLKNKMLFNDFTKYNQELSTINCGSNKLILAFSAPYFLSVAKGNYDLAAQDVSSLIDTTVTGELTGRQLKELNVKYVIVGHSERRIYKKEINIDFINKINEAQNNDLKVIYCIGETLKEKEAGLTEKVLERQILEVLNNIELKDLLIAYEPVWAIGTGNTPDAKDIEKIFTFLKKLIREKYDLNFKILYGGSITPENIGNYSKIPNVDGFLVGGASLKVANVQKMLDILANDVSIN